MEYEGPFGVGKISSFFVWQDTLTLFTLNEFFFKSLKTGKVRKKHLKDFPPFQNNKFMSIGLSSPFENRFISYDPKNEKAYFFVSDNIQRESMIMKLNLLEGNLETIPVQLDTAKLNRFSPVFNTNGKGFISSPNEPSLSLIGQKLILSFPGFNDFIVFDLASNSQLHFSEIPELFPSERNVPIFPSGDLEIKEALKLNSSWQEQVTFGPFGYLENEGLYFRLVEGPKEGDSEKEGEIFIEIFDRNFQKLGEENISNLNQDIKRNYIRTRYGLALIAKDQPDEDVMYFYYLNVSRSK